MTHIQARNLSLVRDGRAILSEIDLEVGGDRLYVLIGPNGAGKTSLLRCLIGFWRDYSGWVGVAGRDSRSMSPDERARVLGYVPQTLDTTFNLDVQGFMECARFPHQNSRDRHREVIDHCLEWTETTDLRDAYLDEISGGELQRVLIASALAQEPEFLLLDEPTAHLDPKHQIETVQLLRRLRKQMGLGILLVSHDWSPFLLDDPEFIAIKEGRIGARGPWPQVEPHLDALYDCAFHRFERAGRLYAMPDFGDQSCE